MLRARLTGVSEWHVPIGHGWWAYDPLTCVNWTHFQGHGQKLCPIDTYQWGTPVNGTRYTGSLRTASLRTRTVFLRAASLRMSNAHCDAMRRRNLDQGHTDQLRQVRFSPAGQRRIWDNQFCKDGAAALVPCGGCKDGIACCLRSMQVGRCSLSLPRYKDGAHSLSLRGWPGTHREDGVAGLAPRSEGGCEDGVAIFLFRAGRMAL